MRAIHAVHMNTGPMFAPTYSSQNNRINSNNISSTLREVVNGQGETQETRRCAPLFRGIITQTGSDISLQSYYPFLNYEKRVVTLSPSTEVIEIRLVCSQSVFHVCAGPIFSFPNLLPRSHTSHSNLMKSIYPLSCSLCRHRPPRPGRPLRLSTAHPRHPLRLHLPPLLRPLRPLTRWMPPGRYALRAT